MVELNRHSGSSTTEWRDRVERRCARRTLYRRYAVLGRIADERKPEPPPSREWD